MIRITECGGKEHGLDSRACYLCGMPIDLTRPWLFLCKIRIISPPIGFCKDYMIIDCVCLEGRSNSETLTVPIPSIEFPPSRVLLPSRCHSLTKKGMTQQNSYNKGIQA